MPEPHSPSKNRHTYKRVSASSKQTIIASKYKPRVKPQPRKKRASPSNLAIRNPLYLRELIHPIKEEPEILPSSRTTTPRGKGKIIGRFTVYDESPIIEKKGRFTIITSPLSPEPSPKVEKKGRFTITESPSPKAKSPSPNKKK